MFFYLQSNVFNIHGLTYNVCCSDAVAQIISGRVVVFICRTDSALQTSVSHTVQRALSHQGFHNFRSRWVFVVTWYNVTSSSLVQTNLKLQL